MNVRLLVAVAALVTGFSLGCGSDDSGTISGTGGAGASAGSTGSAGKDGGSDGTAGNASDAGCGLGKCYSDEQCFNNQLCVSLLVSTTAGYSIDITEVSRTQYAAWLATNPSTTGQPGYCTWNTSFVPDTSFKECKDNPWPPEAYDPGSPVTCVDWCDAFAYCKAIGKRLCGKIGGGANAHSDSNDATKSQWYNVCSSGGKNKYPYGNTYDATKCNGLNMAIGEPTNLYHFPDCIAIAKELAVFHLSGNVAEWEDSCDGTSGNTDGCRVRGGSFLNPEDGLACTDYDTSTRFAYNWVTGFRCCSDP